MDPVTDDKICCSYYCCRCYYLPKLRTPIRSSLHAGIHARTLIWLFIEFASKDCVKCLRIDQSVAVIRLWLVLLAFAQLRHVNAPNYTRIYVDILYIYTYVYAFSLFFLTPHAENRIYDVMCSLAHSWAPEQKFIINSASSCTLLTILTIFKKKKSNAVIYYFKNDIRFRPNPVTSHRLFIAVSRFHFYWCRSFSIQNKASALDTHNITVIMRINTPTRLIYARFGTLWWSECLIWPPC